MLDLTAHLPDGPIPATRVAQYFSVDRRTITNWIKRGLEAQPIEGKVYTTKAAIETFLRRGSPASEQPTALTEDARNAMDRFNSRFGR